MMSYYCFIGLFEDPQVFKPERYLNSQFGFREDVGIDIDTDGFRDNLPFGAGRVRPPKLNSRHLLNSTSLQRICPGESTALATIVRAPWRSNKLDTK